MSNRPLEVHENLTLEENLGIIIEDIGMIRSYRAVIEIREYILMFKRAEEEKKKRQQMRALGEAALCHEQQVKRVPRMGIQQMRRNLEISVSLQPQSFFLGTNWRHWAQTRPRPPPHIQSRIVC